MAWLLETPWIAARQASLSITNSRSSLKFMSIESMLPSNQLILCRPLHLLLQSFTVSGSFPGVFDSSSQVVKVLEIQLQHQTFQWIFRVYLLEGWLVWSPCSPRDSKESSPEPQFKSISSLVLSLLYGPTLTSVHDYWKKNMALTQRTYWQSDVFAF